MTHKVRVGVKRTILVLGALLLVAATSAAAYIGPRNVIGMLRYDQRREGSLKVGDRPRDVALLNLDGGHVQFLDRVGAKPTVLILGSFT